MAGIFVYSKYKADNGDVYRIRIQPETALLSFGSQQNAPTVNAVNQPGILPVRRDVREFGLKSRKVSCKWVSGIPAGYKTSAILVIPILTPEIFLAIELDQTATYLGGVVTIIGKSLERQ